MKSNIQFPAWIMIAALIFAGIVLVLFTSYWWSRQADLTELTQKEVFLYKDIEQLNVIGNWTIEYLKIDKAVDFLTKKKLSEDSRKKLTEQLWQISHSYSVDPLLILAVVAQESRGNPNARGKLRMGKESGAMGLMQIKLETAKSMAKHFGLKVETEEDLFKPEVNIIVGSAYLIRLMRKYGSLKEALMAYNLGHSAVDRIIEKGETLPVRYYERVISNYRILSELSFF